jgi:DNA-directed RNA polymerase subunit F
MVERVEKEKEKNLYHKFNSLVEYLSKIAKGEFDNKYELLNLAKEREISDILKELTQKGITKDNIIISQKGDNLIFSLKEGNSLNKIKEIKYFIKKEDIDNFINKKREELENFLKNISKIEKWDTSYLEEKINDANKLLESTKGIIYESILGIDPEILSPKEIDSLLSGLTEKKRKN